ncbi:3-oxoacyl-(acyl carrier protein) synthase III [Mycobacteroides abscessus subsp. abscessus]|nr:3-oxoacyl-(acyl carrier protein) synthase III [Mycobacteroides abscessus subsp. abscessus]
MVTNDEICERIESSDEWIYTRTGIKTRRFAADEETAQSLAIEAGRKAIANALLTGAEIDAVIVATSTHYLGYDRPRQLFHLRRRGRRGCRRRDRRTRNRPHRVG